MLIVNACYMFLVRIHFMAIDNAEIILKGREEKYLVLLCVYKATFARQDNLKNKGKHLWA